MALRYQKALQDLGLHSQHARVYETLLHLGPTSAQQISKRSGVTRTNTYNVLENLIDRGLVRFAGKATKKIFEVEHPSALENVVAVEENLIKEKRNALERCVSDLVTDFILATSRPTATSFDGMNGVIRAYDELLKDRLPLQSIQDRVRLRQVLSEYNTQFVRERVRRRIYHRVLSTSEQEISSDDKSELREERKLRGFAVPFPIDLKVTSKKIVITTFMSDLPVGVIIVHPDITRGLLTLFDHLWEQSAY